MDSFALFIGRATIVLGGAYFAMILWAYFVNKIGRHISISSDLVRAAYQIRQRRRMKKICVLCGGPKGLCSCESDDG